VPEAQAGNLVRCPTCFSAEQVPEIQVPELQVPEIQAPEIRAPDDIPLASPSAATRTAAVASPLAKPRVMSGRRFGFNCAYCSSRLEAVESQSSDEGACPTCGNNIVIPILDRYGRLIDPLTGKIIKQDPHPVHAYAAAGERAPIILRSSQGEQMIRCPRCNNVSPISANNCKSCGIPFTMEGTAVDAASNSSGMAVSSLVLGIIGLITPCLVIPAVLSVIFGAIALASAQKNEGQGRGMAIAGTVIGGIGVLFAFYFFTR